MPRFLTHFLLIFCFLQANAQWTNRYPKVPEHGHHVYLEGFELPILTSGPMDPAPSPVRDQIVIAAKGWLWLLNLQNLTASRITNSSGIDSRPAWSPDGSKLVFVRDDGGDTQIMLLDLESNTEQVLVDEPVIELDPFFSSDKELVYYASAASGSIDLWAINLTTGEKNSMVEDPGIQRIPVGSGDGLELFYLNKAGFNNSIMQLELENGAKHVIVEGRLTSQADFTIARDGSMMAFTWPSQEGYEIRLKNLENPTTALGLTKSEGMPLAPAFDADAQWIYYTEAGRNERTALKRVSVNGGDPETIRINSWIWNEPTGKIKIISKIDGLKQPVRLNVLDSKGHPVVPEFGAIRSEGQNGMVFYYSDGEIVLEAPTGLITITAVQGFLTEAAKIDVQIETGKTKEVVIDLKRVWEPRASGWYSGDNHFHLNYGGTYQLDPKDIALDMKAEALDVAFPLLANLYLRFLQPELWGWKNDSFPLIRFGQEIRSHFLGHISLIGSEELYWPWIWGPYYEIYTADDRTNAEPLRYAQSQGGLGGYVHPVTARDPFSSEGAMKVPVSLVADCVLGVTDILEVGCLWTDELGTASLWHQILNIGVPLAASGGSDVMNDYYRTMAVGATRVFVKPTGKITIESYLEAVKHGHSFVSNGPMIEFLVDGKGPGEIVGKDSGSVNWSLDVHSALPYQKVEVLVNGEVAWDREVNVLPGSKLYKGKLNIPKGGWVTARVSGGEVKWPFMDSYPYAETNPVWFGSIGSTDPEVARAAAEKLLKVLAASRERLIQGYGDNPIPNLLQQFDKAERHLERIIDQ